MMARNLENTGFICENCCLEIFPVTNGCYRNHCPFCLYSVHLDIVPGDRKSVCRALMKPVQLTYKSKKGWQIIHVCLKCDVKKACRVATDTEQPDSYKKACFPESVMVMKEKAFYTLIGWASEYALELTLNSIF